jgi:hypothetical protein
VQRPQTILSHEARDAMLAARLPGLTKVKEHPERAIETVG